MQDRTGGLQNFLFEWFGWPRRQISTFKGTASEVYVENLLPLFYIEQQDGWTDLQARQVTRYGQQQIAPVSVEYLLGALDAIEARVSRQTAIAKSAALREGARRIAERVQALFSRNGWVVNWSGHGSVEDILGRWNATSLRQAMLRDAGVDLSAQMTRLRDVVAKRRAALSTAPLDPTDVSAPAGASQRLIELKEQRHKLSSDLRGLRVQHEQAARLQESLEHRIAAAQDVLRLKDLGIGRLEVVECPTCHQSMSPETFSLTDQSTDAIQTHIEALRRDRELINRNLASLVDRLRFVEAEILKQDQDIRDADRRLAAVNAATGAAREQLVEFAGQLSAAERDMERLRRTVGDFNELQHEVDTWREEAAAMRRVDFHSSDVASRLSVFTRDLQAYLVTLGHSAMRQGGAAGLRLDEDHVPHMGQRRLRALGSASDKPRVVAAYSLALAAASHAVDGFHPGFVLLDEPLQQNPDDPHREFFLHFLSEELPQASEFQTIIFTSLRNDEIDLLRQRGTNVVVPAEEYFLNSNGLGVNSTDG